VNEENGKPLALVIGDKNFLGWFLSKLLVRQGCRVITEETEASKPDYIFCLDDSDEAPRVDTRGIFSACFGRAKSCRSPDRIGAKADKEKVDKLLSLAQNSGAKFLLVTKKDNYPNASFKNVDFRIVHLGAVFGPRMKRVDFQNLNHQTEIFGPKPVFVSDIVYGLVKTMFAGGTRGRTFDLTAKNSQLGWEPQTDFTQGMEQTKKWFAEPTPTIRPKPTTHLPLLIPILLLFIILSYPFTSLAFQSFWGARNLKKAQQAALSGDFNQMIKTARVAEECFTVGKANVARLGPLFNYVGLEEKILHWEKLYDLGKKTSGGLVDLGSAATTGGQLLGFVLQNKSLDVQQSIGQIKLELDEAYEKLSLVEPQIEDQKLRQQINEVKNLILFGQKGVLLIPDLIGLNKRRAAGIASGDARQVYLILFQNNMELRPTGGFIGSFALLTLDQGRLVDFEVQDVYWADGQLKGHIEPPPALKKYLGEAGWYLRDSNWDPDFPTSAARADWFLEKETGRTVDGVVGINLEVAKNILEAIGETELSDFKEKINSKNLFERAEYHSETNFFPGSTQKQDFLGSLSRALFEKIKNVDQKTWLKLAKAVYQSARQKDILVYFKDPKTQEIVKSLNWDGALRQGFDGELSRTAQCKERKIRCLVDYLMVAEANVGVNKANFFVKRNFSHQIKINKDGLIEETLRLGYQNTAQTEIFPAGKYKSFVRIYTPLKSELVKVALINPQTGTTEEIEKEKVEVKEDHGKQVFGFLLEVPIQENRTIEVVYRLSEKIIGESIQYLLMLQKQSGIKDESFNFWFEPPPGMSIVSSKPLATAKPTGVVFSPKFESDLFFEVEMTP